jgi:hypothetical protein
MALGKDVMSEYQVLVDSDAFVGRFFTDDSHHHHSLALFEKFEQESALYCGGFSGTNQAGAKRG